MLKLNKLHRTVDSSKRVGRGGKLGGTSGKGNKGQKARSGPKIHPLFEGGQTRLVQRMPKRGFNNASFAKHVEIVNLQVLDRVFTAGDVVNPEVLREKGVIKGTRGALIKILGKGALTKKLHVHAHEFSVSAKRLIEASHGEAQVIVQED